MIGLKRLTAVKIGQHGVIIIKHVERDVGGVVLLTVRHHVCCLWLDLQQLQKIAPGDARPTGVEFAPAGDTVNVYRLCL